MHYENGNLRLTRNCASAMLHCKKSLDTVVNITILALCCIAAIIGASKADRGVSHGSETNK